MSQPSQHKGIESFFNAARRGDLDEIKKYLEGHQIPVDQRDANQKTALMLACHFGKVETVKFLLERGANPNLIDHYRGNSLTCLLEIHPFGNDAHRIHHHIKFEIIKILVEAGVDINHRADDKGYSPLHWVAESGSVEMVKFLVDLGASLDGLHDRDTPLHLAIASNSQEVAKYLIAHMDDVDIKGEGKGTPAQFARDVGNLEILMALAQKGACLDLPKGMTEHPSITRCEEYIQEILSIREEQRVFREIMAGSLKPADIESKNLDQKKGLRL